MKDCACKETYDKSGFYTICTVIGILVAILSSYVLITTNSNLFLIFWITYSILRKIYRKKTDKKLEKVKKFL